MSSGGEDSLEYDVNELPIYEFFNYWPSLALACIALTLFALAAGVVAFLTERRGAYRFIHTVTVTGLMEAGGYAALIYAIQMSGKGSVFNAYVAMQVLVIEAPNILQAGLYITVGKVLHFSPQLTRGRKLLRGWVIATIFACADLCAIIIQAIGISIWATSQASGTPDSDKIQLGCAVTLAGLGIQLVCFIGFTVLTIWVHRHPNNGLRGKRETRKLFLALYTAMFFLYVRNIFRFVEFTQNTVLTWPTPDDTFVLAHQQVLFYTLDALPILLCFLPFIFAHPGYLLPAPDSKVPAALPDTGKDPEAGQQGMAQPAPASSSTPTKRKEQEEDDAATPSQQFQMTVLV